ncbi:MAG TPA: hypothetical protein VN704_01760 [Verrucomicrobiae bacterium]|nr:hypothetical protein [Verrucomicrobiae bacterium]
MLGFHTINNKNIELKEINKNKIDEPFQYIPHIFFYLKMPIYFIFIIDKPKVIPQGHAKGKDHQIRL